MNKSKEEILKLLTSVKDPELPFLNVVEMGLVKNISFDGGAVIVSITPTYSGCPAIDMIEQDILQQLKQANYTKVSIKRLLSPLWTTNDLSQEAKEKLKEAGISPPEICLGSGSEQPLVSLRNLKNQHSEHPPCPYCKSNQTKITSEFGPTACKALCICEACAQPFEYFKAI